MNNHLNQLITIKEIESHNFKASKIEISNPRVFPDNFFKCFVQLTLSLQNFFQKIEEEEILLHLILH